jgi:hypothetical protein
VDPHDINELFNVYKAEFLGDANAFKLFITFADGSDATMQVTRVADSSGNYIYHAVNGDTITTNTS